MKWIKLGWIFNPADHILPFNSVGFAQSPQALVLEDRVRVYYSTRERDRTGKFLSQVAFVDFDMDMQSILGVSRCPVITLGSAGCFDEHGIFPFNVVEDNGAILAFYCGLNRKISVSLDSSIGLAISKDHGLTFERIGDGPVIAASLREPFLIADPFVAKVDNVFHMWYIFGVRWLHNVQAGIWDRVYKIAHATSSDGINWHRDARQIIPDKLNSDECQALPTVVCLDGIFHMYFCYRQSIEFRTNKDSAYRIGYAYSTDLVQWTRDDANAGIEISDKGWDSEMQCYPHIFKVEKKTYMLYNGNQFGEGGFGAAVLEKN